MAAENKKTQILSPFTHKKQQNVVCDFHIIKYFGVGIISVFINFKKCYGKSFYNRIYLISLMLKVKRTLGKREI